MQERLQKLIAQAGIASRRHAEEIITAGEVTVNGQIVTELGAKADPDRDHIKVRGRLINGRLAAREKVYLLVNKPRGFLSSALDEAGRPLVVDLVPASFGKLHTIGRLDFNTEGLIILTNDGALTNHVTSARNHIPKVYEVKVKGVPPDNSLEKLRRGITLDDGVRTAPAHIAYLKQTDSNTWFEVVLYEGRNQQIRRMFDSVGHSVIKLRRTHIAHLTDARLRPGEFRLLAPAEVARFFSRQRFPAPAERPKFAGKNKSRSPYAQFPLNRKGKRDSTKRSSSADTRQPRKNQAK